MYYATELLNTALTLKGSGYHNITARVGLENEMYEQKCLAIFISFKSAMEIPLSSSFASNLGVQFQARRQDLILEGATVFSNVIVKESCRTKTVVNF